MLKLATKDFYSLNRRIFETYKKWVFHLMDVIKQRFYAKS
ncbi:hypothetical protein LEP1GSC088_4600 [Leptospira interrogans str. L1207]|nr:hypothetical protein LEP1GSC088_4600 [Leptospira interrogans str. L1207]